MDDKKKGGAFFPVLFGLISLLFIVILIVAYRLTVRTPLAHARVSVEAVETVTDGRLA